MLLLIIKEFLKKYKGLISLIFIILFSINFQSFKFSYIVYYMNDLINPVLNFINIVKSIDDIYKENKVLNSMVAELTLLNFYNNYLVIENRNLKKMLNYKENEKYTLILGKVLSYHPDLLSDYIIVDKGIDDSIKPDMAVINTKGIIGITTKVSSKTSIVELISSPNIKISIFNKKGGYGILSKLKEENSFSIELVEDASKFSVGDTIYSSGLGGIFPKGIPIGKIYEIKKQKFSYYPLIKVKIFVNLKNIQDVFIIKREI